MATFAGALAEPAVGDSTIATQDSPSPTRVAINKIVELVHDAPDVAAGEWLTADQEINVALTDGPASKDLENAIKAIANSPKVNFVTVKRSADDRRVRTVASYARSR